MKALSGGLITNAAAAFAFQAQFPETLPLWAFREKKSWSSFFPL